MIIDYLIFIASVSTQILSPWTNVFVHGLNMSACENRLLFWAPLGTSLGLGNSLLRPFLGGVWHRGFFVIIFGSGVPFAVPSLESFFGVCVAQHQKGQTEAEQSHLLHVGAQVLSPSSYGRFIAYPLGVKPRLSAPTWPPRGFSFSAISLSCSWALSIQWVSSPLACNGHVLPFHTLSLVVLTRDWHTCLKRISPVSSSE